MAFTVELINVSEAGARTLPIDGDRITVEPGGVVKVTPEQAGEPPHWRKADDADELLLAVNPEALHWRIRAGAVEVYDLGSGLLAQPANWRRKDEKGDPADPTADGHGGIIDPVAQAAALAEAQRAAQTEQANDTSETEQS